MQTNVESLVAPPLVVMDEVVMDQPSVKAQAEPRTAYGILGAISFAHLLNDMIQSLVLAIYPVLKGSFNLNFTQLSLITLTYQVSASLLQPLVGMYTDRRPLPYSLPIGMGFTLLGLVLLAVAPTFPILLLAAALVGTGSSVFHPESSRVARMASGGQHGLAQSLFQVGGNVGASLGPLMAAWIIVPHGRASVGWFSLAALLAIVVLLQIGHWYARNHVVRGKPSVRPAGAPMLSRGRIVLAMTILCVLIFSKYFYLASISSFYIFYLTHTFGVSVQNAELHLSLFLFAVAAGTVVGGRVGDRIGRKWVIWVSILGVAPFTLLLPHANLFWTGVLSVLIGLILSSAFSAILVYAQELVPGRVGMISGLFFGFAFGMGGVGAFVLGNLVDAHGIVYVYHLCAYLPLIGIVTMFLPDMKRRALAS